ncbi:MAG: PaaI family thioesterase [Proteobacteria bacterium]|nr:PaaI family thioesterase [Pseudomonadota bacterium]
MPAPAAHPAPAARFQPQDPGFAARCRDSFARQKAMVLIGGTIAELQPGYCEVVLPFRDDLTQQKGFVHGGIIGMIADSACGYAAFSLMPADCSLVTVEYKINILAPTVGERLVARGEVMRPGRTLTVARAEVYAEKDGRSVHCASMQQTLMMLAGRSDRPD